MKLTILVENHMSANSRITRASETCFAEWGLSAFLETDQGNILFDSGHSANYKNNAKNLGIDLDTADFIVLSHHHWDHAKGLANHDFIDKKKLVLHPDVITKISDSDRTLFENDFEVISSSEPMELLKGIHFLGEVPRETTFEQGKHKDDPMKDDTGLAISTENGLIVLTGCSHAGVVNICEYAKRVTSQKLYTVAGGFHLFENDSTAIEGAIDYFKSQAVKNIYPMHCIDEPTFVRFFTELGATRYATGDTINLL